MALTQAKH